MVGSSSSHPARDPLRGRKGRRPASTPAARPAHWAPAFRTADRTREGSMKGRGLKTGAQSLWTQEPAVTDAGVPSHVCLTHADAHAAERGVLSRQSPWRRGAGCAVLTGTWRVGPKGLWSVPCLQHFGAGASRAALTLGTFTMSWPQQMLLTSLKLSLTQTHSTCASQSYSGIGALSLRAGRALPWSTVPGLGLGLQLACS